MAVRARRRESTSELARRIPTGRRRRAPGHRARLHRPQHTSTVPGMSTAVQTAPPHRREPLPQRTAALSPCRAADFMSARCSTASASSTGCPSPQPGRRPRHPRARRAGAALRPARGRAHARARRRAARAASGSACSRRSPSSPTLFADDGRRRRPATWFADARQLLETCFTLEDPHPPRARRARALRRDRRWSGLPCAATSTGSTSPRTARCASSTTRPAARRRSTSRPRRCSR